MDNGWPWGSSGDLPPFLALWLVGLGVGVIHNPARSPQDNARVERFHGLIEPWAEPKDCPDFATWQERLVWLSQVQRERYPSVGKQSRWQAFPELARVGRPYASVQEAAVWDLERVKAYLAQGLWVRQVDQIGRVTLYHRARSVGRAHKHEKVFVRFDAETTEWVMQDDTGAEVGRKPAEEISVLSITDLESRYSRHVASARQSGVTL